MDNAVQERALKTMSLADLQVLYLQEEARQDEACERVEEQLSVEHACCVELKEAREVETAALDAVRRARGEASAAAADAGTLAAQLPELLGSRGEELNECLEEVTVFTKACEAARLAGQAAREVRDRRREETDDLWQEADAWRQRLRPQLGVRESVDQRLAGLRERSQRAYREFDELEAQLSLRAAQEKQQGDEMGELKWRSETLNTQFAIARRRHEESATECFEQTTSFVLAKQLEVEGLRRSLALSYQQLQVKSREAEFFKERARHFTDEFKSASLRRDREVAGLLRQPVPPPASAPRPPANAQVPALEAQRGPSAGILPGVAAPGRPGPLGGGPLWAGGVSARPAPRGRS